VLSAVAPEDKKAWHGELPPDTLRDFSKALSWRRAMDQGEGPSPLHPADSMPSMRPGLALRTGNCRQALRMNIDFNLPYPPTINTYWRYAGGRALLSKRGRQTGAWPTEKPVEPLSAYPTCGIACRSQSRERGYGGLFNETQNPLKYQNPSQHIDPDTCQLAVL